MMAHIGVNHLYHDPGIKAAVFVGIPQSFIPGLDLNAVNHPAANGAVTPGGITAAKKAVSGVGIGLFLSRYGRNSPLLKQGAQTIIASQKPGEGVRCVLCQVTQAAAAGIAAPVECVIALAQGRAGNQVSQLQPFFGMTVAMNIDKESGSRMAADAVSGGIDKTVIFPPGLFGVRVALGGFLNIPVGIQLGAP